MSMHYNVSLPDDNFIETHVCPSDKLISILVGHKNGLNGLIDKSMCLEIDDRNIEYIIRSLTLVHDEYLSLIQNTQTK